MTLSHPSCTFLRESADLPTLLTELLSLAISLAPPELRSKASENSAANEKESRKEASREDTLRPRLDIYSTSSFPNYTATLDLPGFSKADVSISVRHDRLIVTASKPTSTSTQENEDAPVEWKVRERVKGAKWVREVPIAVGIKPSEIKASMVDGVLTITFPKEAAVLEAQVSIE